VGAQRYPTPPPLPPPRLGSYSPAWLDALCAAGELVWVGAGPPGRRPISNRSGRVALYFREDAPLLGPPLAERPEPPQGAQHALLRERLAQGPCFFTDLLAELDAPAAELAQALWDLVWWGEATNDSCAPLRAPRQALSRASAALSAHSLQTPARSPQSLAAVGERTALGALRAPARPRSVLGARSTLRGGRGAGGGPLQGRWSLTEPLFAAQVDPARRRRAQAELLLQRYGLLTREQVSAEGVVGGFSGLYNALSELETLGVCRRGYFVEGLGGAQFALPGAVERLRSSPQPYATVLAAMDPAQPYGAALGWPARERPGRGPARVDGAYVVLVDAEPVLYLERGGRSLLTLQAQGAHEDFATPSEAPARQSTLTRALDALVQAVRAGTVGRMALERIDGEPAIGSVLQPQLARAGFSAGPRRLTLRG
jgi:ATP-dependent helicase Lhr and Lhr-like helicase